MGFTIFTASGTFSPSTYGLNPGDTIHVKVVGGGGGGSGAGTAGTAGSSSSFGSIVSAAGGNGGVSGSGSLPTAQTGSCQGLPGGLTVGMYWYSSSSGSYWSASSYSSGFGGGGGAGWVPGEISLPVCASFFLPFIYSHAGSISMSTYLGLPNTFPVVFNLTSSNAAQSVSGVPTVSSGQNGNYGGVYCRYYGSYAIGGAGGLGYGAGGGGCCYVYSSTYIGSGGNGGVIADKDYVLTSTSSIAVTVGAGGAGASSGVYCGGGGANGCVAIWW